MNISNETQQKINRFADEHSQHYLENTEMTYMEKLRGKSSRVKNKVGEKMAKFRSHSERGREVRGDIILYMNDYMSDLISQGMNEKEAFDKASAEMAEAGESKTRYDGIIDYYSKKSPEEYASEGIFYGGFSIIGIVTGGLIGYLTGGGRSEFLSGGWIDLLIGLGCGAVLGTGIAMIVNAVIGIVKRK